MSGAYIDNLKVWTRDGSEVRVYIHTRYMDWRHAEAGADGAFLKANEDGSIGWSHGFRTGPDTVTKAECVAFGARAVIDALALSGVAFTDLLHRISECKTKGGNFSHRQYEKRFLLTD